MLSLCDEVSLYGFTTYPQSKQGGDQYAGNRVKMGSGWTWHDWLGESQNARACIRSAPTVAVEIVG